MRVSEEPVCIYFSRKNPFFTSLYLRSPVHDVPPQFPASWFCHFNSNWALSVNLSKKIKKMIFFYEEQFSRLRIFQIDYGGIQTMLSLNWNCRKGVLRPSIQRKNIWFRNKKPLNFAGLWTRRVNLSLVSPLPSPLPSPGNVSSACMMPGRCVPDRTKCPQTKSLGRSVPWVMLPYVIRSPRDTKSRGYKSPDGSSSDTFFTDTTSCHHVHSPSQISPIDLLLEWTLQGTHWKMLTLYCCRLIWLPTLHSPTCP